MRRQRLGVCQYLISCFLVADPANLATIRLFSLLMKTICSGGFLLSDKLKTKIVSEEHKLPTMVYVPLRFAHVGQLFGNDVHS